MLLVQSAFNSYEQYYFLFAASPTARMTITTATATAIQTVGLAGFVSAAIGPTSSGTVTFAAIVCGVVSTLNGPPMSTVATNGPFTFLGSRHESRHVPPQPYSKVKVRSYEPSSLLIRTFGAGGRSPLQVSSIRSLRCPARF